MNYTKLFFDAVNSVLKDNNLVLTYNNLHIGGGPTRKIDLPHFKYNLDNTPSGFEMIELSGKTNITIKNDDMYVANRYELAPNGYDTMRAIRYVLSKAREILIKDVMSKSNVFKIDDNFYLLTKHRWSDTRYELTRINPINNNAPTDEYRYFLTNNNDMELSNHFLSNTNTSFDHLDRIIPIFTKPFDLTEIDHFKVADADKNAVFIVRTGRSYGKFFVDANELGWFPRCVASGYLTTALANYFNERVNSHISLLPVPTTYLVNDTMPKCDDCEKRDLSLFNKEATPINIKFRGNSHLCDKCADDVVNKGIDLAVYTAGKYNVGGYSSNPRSLNFGKFDSESTPLYMGIELEVDTSTRNANDVDDEEYHDADQRYDQDEHNYNSNYALHIMSGGKDTIFTKTDGSLNNGFEIVSHPMTLAKHLRTMQWQKGMEYLTKMGYKSHNTSTCGLHIHINRNFFGSKSVQGINGAKIAYLLERTRQDVVKFTRRRTEELERWARFGDMARWFNNATPRTKSMLSTAFRSQYSPRNKYVALNTIHANTFEFRIFKGTLNFGTLVASMQFVDNLARIVKDIPNNDTMFEALDKIKFDDIINYRPYAELTAYWDKRKAV
jgi:hypothetical protein